VEGYLESRYGSWRNMRATMAGRKNSSWWQDLCRICEVRNQLCKICFGQVQEVGELNSFKYFHKCNFQCEE